MFSTEKRKAVSVSRRLRLTKELLRISFPNQFSWNYITRFCAAFPSVPYILEIERSFIKIIMRHRIFWVIKDTEPLQESRHRRAVIKIKRDCFEAIFWMILQSPTHSRNRSQLIYFTNKQYLCQQTTYLENTLASLRGLGNRLLVFSHGVRQPEKDR